MKEALKETHVFPFFCAFCHPRNCQGREAKNRWVSGSGNESLVSKCGTKCTQKNPCPGMHGFCNFAVFVNQKNRAPERVKRDPHVFVLFLHPKKCLTCGAKSLRSFWFWKRSPEPLLGSFLDVQRYLQNPNSRVVSGIFASFSRALEPWAVQNIQKGKKVVECKSCSKSTETIPCPR